ncbi:MAG: hypothetical protein GY864_10970 [Desulfobacterales bacterium]|nr:hypothetical protein [Desulfobacterales bacterium]
MKKSGLFFVVISMVFFSGPQVHTLFSAELCNRVVAVVNSDVITLYGLNSKIRQMTGSDPNDLRMQDGKKFMELRRQILEAMIDEKVANAKAQELGIEISAKEVDASIERVKTDNHLSHEDLIAGLKEEGMSYESYRETIKDQFKRMQLVNFEVKSRIIISDQEIQAYYNEHKSEFSTDEKVHLAGIFLGQEDESDRDLLNEILSRLKNGEDFGELANKYSRGPGAEQGGDLGFFKPSDLAPEIVDVINNMSPGDVSGPIIRPEAIQIIRLIAKVEKGVAGIEASRNTIYNTLYQEEVNNRYTSWIKELRKEAHIRVIF